ncbi:CLUMA_CG008923, isoform A [Clunio marinus]|uniref:CLUMA_CG008923, isoform A n=1 Tax=Clunio marinus TaxID=568069 RepID=A0A1J1I913_9DIPT|nr:CLUMA_CG008923, isoform A [Clunio marinus]
MQNMFSLEESFTIVKLIKKSKLSFTSSLKVIKNKNQLSRAIDHCLAFTIASYGQEECSRILNEKLQIVTEN